MITTSARLEWGSYRPHESRDQAKYVSKDTLLGLENRGKNRMVFGIVIRGQMTHMAYYIRDLNPLQSLRRIRNSEDKHFYFDAGQNGSPVRICADELERIYRLFGLIADD